MIIMLMIHNNLIITANETGKTIFKNIVLNDKEIEKNMGKYNLFVRCTSYENITFIHDIPFYINLSAILL